MNVNTLDYTNLGLAQWLAQWVAQFCVTETLCPY